MLRTLSLKHALALAALDVDSDVDVVHLASNAEDLKRRLKALLGRRPDTPLAYSDGAATHTAKTTQHFVPNGLMCTFLRRSRSSIHLARLYG
jgi:hypothetical protein